jgi:hypothetical protein
LLLFFNLHTHEWTLQDSGMVSIFIIRIL